MVFGVDGRVDHALESALGPPHQLLGALVALAAGIQEGHLQVLDDGRDQQFAFFDGREGRRESVEVDRAL